MAEEFDFLNFIQTEVKNKKFSTRMKFFNILQYKATLAIIKDGGGASHLIAWPDALYYVTPQMAKDALREAIEPDPPQKSHFKLIK